MRLHRLVFPLGATSIAAIVVAIYWKGLSGPFVFDDIANIVLVEAIRLKELSAWALNEAMASGKSGPLGRPLAVLTFALTYYFVGFDAFWFKLTNLVIHLATGLALYFLSRALLSQLRRLSPSSYPPLDLRWAVLFITALWLIHPLQLTSVLYIVQRMTSLSALFTVLGVLAYVKGRQRIIAGDDKGLLIAATAAIYAIPAALSKENGILIFPLIVAVELIAFRMECPLALNRRFKQIFIGLFLFPLAVGIVLVAYNADSLFGAKTYMHREFTLVERVLTEARAVWFYIELIIFPSVVKMGIFHDDFPISRNLFSPPSTAFAVAGIFVLLGTIALSFRRQPILALGLSWFLIGHSMESTVFPLELVHEHRNYLPLYGMALIIGYYLFHPALTFKQYLKTAIVAVYFALLSFATASRATDWKDELTLYASDVAHHPGSARAHTSLAIILHDNKAYNRARAHFEHAVELSPNEIEAVVRLAQHHYISSGSVPLPVFAELERRVAVAPFSGITLWIFQPFLQTSLRDNKLNDRLSVVFERLLDRPLNLPNDWRAAGYQILAENARARSQDEKALAYYARAIAQRESAYFYIASARLLLKSGKIDSAKRMLHSLNARNAKMTKRDAEELQKLESDLAQPNGKEQ